MGKNRWSQGREFQRRAWRHQRRSCRNIDGSRNRFRLRIRFRKQLGETGMLEGKLHLLENGRTELE